MSEKLIVDWNEYNKTVERLAIQVHESGYKPTLLVGIMRGGAPMIDVLSRVFKLKCAYLAVESYSGKGVEDEQGNIVFSREMSSIAKNMGGKILLCDDNLISGEIFNAGYENHSVLELANTVKKVIGDDVSLKSSFTNDNRSYHISSKKIKKTLGFEPMNTISDAVNDLKLAFKKGLLPNSLTDEKYFNIKMMQSLNLK